MAIIFEPSNINIDKSPQENIKTLRSYIGELVDKLNLLSGKVEELEKKLDEKGEDK